jgi:hypothetical protein
MEHREQEMPAFDCMVVPAECDMVVDIGAFNGTAPSRVRDTEKGVDS